MATSNAGRMRYTEDRGKRTPGEWVPERYIGQKIDGGKISQESRWWSLAWWRAHWLKRRVCGQFRDKDGSRACHKAAGHSGPHGDFRPITPRARAEQRRQTYAAYLAAQFDSADSACRGRMVSAAGEKRGFTARSLWFSGRKGSAKWATEEMRDWLRDHGAPLTPAEFREQTGEGMYGYPV